MWRAVATGGKTIISEAAEAQVWEGAREHEPLVGVVMMLLYQGSPSGPDLFHPFLLFR